MDKFERCLKEDAAKIRADVSAELSTRLDASIRATERARPNDRNGRQGFSTWWISGLTGATAVLLAIVLLNRGDPVTPTPSAELPIAGVVPEYERQAQSEFPLRAETAVLTEPLEEELEKLKSDLERVREDLEADLRRSF